MMAVVHVVLFEFKSTLNASDVTTAVDSMLQLEKKCVDPNTQKPYIKSIAGGKNNSKEGLSGGLSHGFVVHFDSVKDRDYYCDDDPAHQAFKKSLGGMVEKVTVFDLVPGGF